MSSSIRCDRKCDIPIVPNYTLFPKLPKNMKIPFQKPRFKLNFSEKECVDNVMLVDSGTSALYLVLKEIGLNSTDEVIMPSFVCKSVANAVLSANGTPVFADIGTNDFNINVDTIKEVMTSNTKVIIMVHQYGKYCDFIGIRKLCDDNDIILIDDSAVCNLGDKGHYGIRSFNMGKPVMCMGGSAVIGLSRYYSLGRALFPRIIFFVTNIYLKKYFVRVFYHLVKWGIVKREEDISKLYEETNKKDVNIIPRKMHWLQKLLLHDIDDVCKWIDRAELYSIMLEKVPNLIVPNLENNICFVYTILVEDRYELANYLAEHGIETYWTFHPLHLQSKYKGYQTKELPNTDKVWKKTLSLPIEGVTDIDIIYICNLINDYYGCYR